jgi:inhibitor of cysteine peptidase
MITRNHLLLLLSGIGAGLIIAILAMTATTSPLSPAVTTIPATLQPTVTIISPPSEIREFSDEADARAFLKARITPDESLDQRVNASGSAAWQRLFPNGTRRWSYTVDTATFRPDEYIVTADAIIQDATGTALFNVVDPSSPARDTYLTPASVPMTGGYFISVNPIRDHYVGDRFVISGYTNLPKGAEILVQVYSSSFKPTQKSQSGEFSGSTGTISTSDAVSFSSSSSSITSPAVQGTTWSGTNIQVSGVDEADIIKTDGKYIYAITGNMLEILQAYPPDSARVLASRQFPGTPQDLYLYGNRLVLITETDEPQEFWDCGTGQCSSDPLTLTRTSVFVFSVDDPAHPGLLREIKIDGRYKDSRMIKSVLYFISTGTVDPYADELSFPKIADSGTGASTPRVYYFDSSDSEYALTVVGSVDIMADKPVQAKTFLVGSAGTVYVSSENLYIAVPSYQDYRSAKRQDATAVYAFELDGGRLSYTARGTIGGTLLNQFSLDEYGGYLRVATTRQGWNNGGNFRSSTVSVLDRNLDTVGSLDDLAPGEQIYAARFMGERLYLVTYRETDPLFVIDLARPTSPKVLGELHIPGFSRYIHPYDATHIIGIGKESTRGGLKIALFDVADVYQPHLISEKILGSYGSDSEVLRDHRAFLFDKEKNLLVLPAHIVEPAGSSQESTGSAGSMTGPSEWTGTYVFNVSVDNGFGLKGIVIHNRGSWKSGWDVKRALYIDNILYTMSPEKIVMSDLANGTQLVGEVRFGERY